MPASAADFLTQLADIFSRVRPATVLEFPGYLLLGCYLHENSLFGKSALWAVLLGLAAFGYTAFMTARYSLGSGAPTEAFPPALSVPVLAIVVFAVSGAIAY